MATDDNDDHLGRELINAIDKAITEGPWEKGLLFQAIGKKLHALRDRFEKELKISATSHPAHPHAAEIPANVDEEITVFISLYMNDGANIPKWEKFLNAIGNNIVTRPIYRNEEDLLYALRAKENKINDAYVSAKVRIGDIINPMDSKPLSDRYGHELLLIRQGAIQTRNIRLFIHKSGRYTFKNGYLIKQAEQSQPAF